MEFVSLAFVSMRISNAHLILYELGGTTSSTRGSMITGRFCEARKIYSHHSRSTPRILTGSDRALFRVKEEMKRLIAKHPRGIDGFEEPLRASSEL